MIEADALAGPALLALFAAVPACSVLAGFGRRGVLVALVIFGALAAANFLVAFNVTEYGEFGAGIAAIIVFFMPILMLVSWHIGEFLRERRASPGKRHRLSGE